MQKNAIKIKGCMTFLLAFSLAWLVLLADPAGAADNTRLQELERKIEKQKRMLEAQQAMIKQLSEQMQALKQESEASAKKAEAAKRVADDVNVEVFGKAIVTSDDPRFSVKVNGQVNRQVLYASDGHRSKFYHTDSDNLPTWINVVAEGKVSEDLTIGGRIESAYQENRPLRTNQNNENSGFDFSSRFAEVYLDSKRFGKLQVGKGWASSFTLFETDLSGTQPVSLLSVGNLFGGLLFWNRDDNEFTDIPVAGVFFDAEQLSLVNRVRYDSPQFYGLQLSGSWGSDQRSDVTLRWKDEIGDFQFSGASSYQRNTSGLGGDWRVDGVLGALHKPTGLNLAGGAALFEKRVDDQNAHGWIVKAGWRKKLFGFGESKFSADLLRQFDTLTNQEYSTSYGAFWVQDIDRWGMQLYTGYRYYDYDRSDFDTSPIHVPVIGTVKYF